MKFRDSDDSGFADSESWLDEWKDKRTRFGTFEKVNFFFFFSRPLLLLLILTEKRS